ncbi:cytidylate kinase-like family protein [bacterium]|nr:cytidylate kinase-like family protein [bacterium]
MAVITISRQFSTAGYEMARTLSDTLGYSFYCKQIIDEVAHELGISSQLVKEYQDEFEHTANWAVSAYAGRFKLLSQNYIEAEEYGRIVAEILGKLAHKDDIVILGSGGQCLLQNTPNIFHFRFVSNLESRIKHLKSHYHNPEDIPPHGMLTYRVNHLDELRRKFIKNHFQADIDDPSLYHAIFNLSRFSKAEIIEIITGIIPK